MVYNWRTGSHHTVAADVAAEVMNGLAERGCLNAETLVDVSRPEDAPLHPEFEWDDSIAAEEWRKHQARNVINSIVVQTEPNKEPERVFFNIREIGCDYIPMRIILQSPDNTELLIQQATKELKAFQSKYDAIVKRANAENDLLAFMQKLETI